MQPRDRQEGSFFDGYWFLNASPPPGGLPRVPVTVPLEIKINGNPADGQIYAVGQTIAITVDVRAWAEAGQTDFYLQPVMETLTDAALEVSGPSGVDAETAGDHHVFQYGGYAHTDTTLTIPYLLTAPGLHTVSASSTARVVIITRDVDESETVTDELTFQVSAGNDPPAADAGGPYSGSEGSAVAIAGTANDPESDLLTYAWSYSPGIGVDSGAACSFADATALATTVSCTDDGAYSLTLSVGDGVNPPVADEAVLTVDNVAPTVDITLPEEGALYTVNDSVGLAASLADAGANDTHSCTLDWGDGTLAAGAVDESGGAGSCTGAHAYASAGVYLVGVSVADDDGGSGSAQGTVVVYDPAAGFVTGGGWIDGPAGAYTADPSLAGRATFGLVSKNKKGQIVPGGNTEFQIAAAGFRFHSETYEWLVVSQGGTSAQFKGSGRVNGGLDPNGNPYRFTIWVGDGSPDTFRIKIWWEDNGTEVAVYDNGTDQPLGGGSIVIHTK